MCLTKRVKYKSVPKYGYKIFWVDGYKDLRPECTCKIDRFGDRIVYKKGVVYQTTKSSNGERYIGNSKHRYKAGYHCFTTIAGAKKWIEDESDVVIYKVAIDKIVAQGVQNLHRVVVAQQFKLIKRIR